MEARIRPDDTGTTNGACSGGAASDLACSGTGDDVPGPRESLLGFSASILADLPAAGSLASTCDDISRRLTTFFNASHVALGLINLSARRCQVLGFNSSVLERDALSTELADADVEAYRQAIEGRPQCFSDLGDTELNPGTELARRAGIRSLIRSPFALSDGSVGLITVGSTVSGHFSEEHGGRLFELSRTIGLVVDRLRLADEMEHARSVLDAQGRILAALSPSVPLEGLARTFVDETRRVFGATHASIVLGAADGTVEVLAMSSDEVGESDIAGTRMADPNERQAYARVLRGEPEIVDLAAIERRRLLEQRAFEKGLRTLMRVPLLNRFGGVIGVVAAGSPERGRWRANDLASLQQLSGALGLVLERRDLIVTSEMRREKAASLTRILTTLNATAAPEEVAQAIASEVRTLAGADTILIHGFDLEAGVRVRVAIEGDDFEDDAPLVTPLSESTTYLGLQETRSAVFDANDPEAAPKWFRVASERLGMGSSVAIRLDGSTGPAGMIALGCREPGAIGREALDLLDAIVPPLAMLLERARVVTSLREQHHQSAAILDILSALGPKDSFTEIAGPIAAAIRAMYKADHCAVTVIERGNVMLAGRDSEYGNAWPVGGTLPRDAHEGDDGAVEHVFADLQSPGLGLSCSSVTLRDQGMRSSMRVLLGSREAPLGVVTVGSSGAGRYSEADARRLAAIAHPLAVAVAYFQGKREADVRAARLEAMNRVLMRLGAGGTPDYLAAGFLAECRALFDCEHAVVRILDDDGVTIRQIAVDSAVVPAESSPAKLVEVDNACSLVESVTLTHDIRQGERSGAECEMLVAAGMFSAIEVPVTLRDRQIGMVSLWGAGTNRFTQDDVDTLVTLTRSLAITLERASALGSLAESELKYRSLVAQAEEMIFLFDGATLQMLEANQYTERALGYTRQELLALTVDDLVEAEAEDVRANVARTIRQGELHIPERQYRRKDGSVLDVDVIASQVAYGGREAVLALVRDVSERKSMHAHLVQGQKMESLGLMAGNLAHDFNNVLTTILGFSGLLKRSPNMDIDERENLGLIEDAARRAADLTGRLLAFARGGLVRFGPVDLRTVVDDTLHLAGPSLHNNLEVTTTLPAGPVTVEGDAGQIQQALLNIILNAKDAMPEGGRISVSLQADDATATVTIADNGPGMSAETRTRIFEPFYTTKPIGSGTGLGMAITYGIVQGHHGDVTVESSLGAGTTFRITLPLFTNANGDYVGGAYNPGEGNLILVVDDDDMVRRTTSATLAEIGYNVVEAPGGATAVQVVKARPDRFSAVLLDLVMPGMTGSETFRALTAIRADLPVIVCTGYAADAHIDTDIKRRIAGLVQKPFTAERLARALSEAGVLPTRR